MTRFQLRELRKRKLRPEVLFFQDLLKKNLTQGEVISVGPGKKNDSGEVVPVNVKAGDTVLFGQYAGNEVKVDGEEYLIMSESDIFGVIE